MNLKLTRNQLAAFLKDPESIKQFEQLFRAADMLDATASEALISSDAAQNSASEALSLIDDLKQSEAVNTGAIDLTHVLAEAQKLIQDAQLSMVEPQLGTLSQQNADRVQITGGTIAGLAAPLPVNSGGTGQSVYTDGQLLIGNSFTNGLTKSGLSAGSNIIITTGSGSITIGVTGLGTMAFKNVGITGTATLAKITGLGSDGSLTFTDGIITAYTAPT